MVAVQMSASRTCRTAQRIYSAALLALPRWLRDRYGDDMRATFAVRCRDAAADGRLPLVLLLLRELADVLAAAVRARRATMAVPTPSRVEPSRRSAMNALAQDLRYAFRLLRRQPGFAAVAVVTLALGIGATTAVFTVVNGVLLRPLPYADPDHLLLLLNGRAGRLSTSFSPPNYRDITEQSGMFTAAAAFDAASVTLTGNGDPQRLDGSTVTGAFFQTLGVRPRYGRAIDDSDVAANRRRRLLAAPVRRAARGDRPDAEPRRRRV
jgi:hypothetical protein